MTESVLDAVVVSAIGIDTAIFLYGADVDFTVESNFSQNIDYVGQAGGFSSRGFAQLGYRTGFIGYVGDDHNGRFLSETLAGDGIEAALFIDPAGTRRSINFMYRDGRRKNFYDGKGGMNVRPDPDVCRQMLGRTRLAHFNIENWARYLLPLARESGVVISCDVQDMVSLDDEYRRDFIEYADVLFFSGTNFPEPRAVIGQLLDARPDHTIIVGMGSQGALLGTAQGIQQFGPLNIDATVIDTNGAGDGLAVGFLSSRYIEGYSPEDAVLRGQITARYTCTQKATSSNLITRQQLDNYFTQLR